jgi:hypothetical protein
MTTLSFTDHGGTLRSGRALRVAGVHLVCEVVLSDGLLSEKQTYLVSASMSTSQSQFWNIYRLLGGSNVVDEDGDPL